MNGCEGKANTELELSISRDILPYYFGDPEIPHNPWILWYLPVKKYSMTIPESMESTESNQWTSNTCTGHLVCAMVSSKNFYLADHALWMVDGKYSDQDSKNEAAITRLWKLCTKLGKVEYCTTIKGGKIEAWISSTQTHIHGISLCSHEWRNFLLSRYTHVPGPLTET